MGLKGVYVGMGKEWSARLKEKKTHKSWVQ